ncbi:hypothetical protein C8J57DRAFT_1222154 [Mycena rebaudengoi]|nr:hypothetical protein C8J57DRAFT_1222154 [Mycena rebaudengoi]
MWCKDRGLTVHRNRLSDFLRATSSANASPVGMPNCRKREMSMAHSSAGRRRKGRGGKRNVADAGDGDGAGRLEGRKGNGGREREEEMRGEGANEGREKQRNRSNAQASGEEEVQGEKATDDEEGVGAKQAGSAKMADVTTDAVEASKLKEGGREEGKAKQGWMDRGKEGCEDGGAEDGRSAEGCKGGRGRGDAREEIKKEGTRHHRTHQPPAPQTTRKAAVDDSAMGWAAPDWQEDVGDFVGEAGRGKASGTGPGLDIVDIDISLTGPEVAGLGSSFNGEMMQESLGGSWWIVPVT